MKLTIPTCKKGIKDLEDQIDDWRAHPKDNASLRKLYTQDRKNLRRVLTLYKSGQWKEAGEFASRLDTMVRDMIPYSIWNHIQQAAYGHEE